MEDAVEITLPSRYSLYYTFMSSFACYLFELKKDQVTNSEWVGLVDPFVGVTVRQAESKLLFEFTNQVTADTKEYVIRDVTGLWHEPKAVTDDSRAARILELLSDRIFPGIRVPRLWQNRWEVLSSILFSIHAKMPMSRMWFASVYKNSKGNWKGFAEMSPSEVMELTALGSGQSAGFRARYLLGAIKDLYKQYPGAEDPLQEVANTSITRIRTRLMKVIYVGPKVADCFLLNALGDVSTPPIDVNVYRVAQNLGIVPPYLGLPSAELCAICACTPNQSRTEGVPLCPKAERTIDLLEGRTESVSGTCVRSAMAMKFSDAGWVQAMLFLYGQRFCTSNFPSCQTCELREFSVLEQISGVIPTRKRVPKPKPIILEPYIPENIPVFSFYPERKKDCLEYMNKIYQIMKKQVVIPHRSSKSCLAALLWLAVKQNGVPAFVDEVAEAYETDSRDLLNLSSTLRFTLELSLPNIEVSSYIERLQKVMLFSEELLQRAIEIANSFSDTAGKRPESVAAASLYLALRGTTSPATLQMISDSLGITEVTTRNVSKMLKKRAKQG